MDYFDLLGGLIFVSVFMLALGIGAWWTERGDQRREDYSDWWIKK